MANERDRRDRRDWIVILLILALGLLFILLASGWALRFSPHWELPANMESNLDPNRDFLTRRPGGFIEALDPAILTQPAWLDIYLTPGAAIPTGAVDPATSTESSSTQTALATGAGTQVATATAQSSTSTAVITSTANPTNTTVYYPPPSSSTPQPNPAATQTPTSAPPATATQTPTTNPAFTATPTSTVTPTSNPAFTATPTPTATQTPTDTPTATQTPTSTPTATPTNTPDPSEPDFGGPDGNTITLGSGSYVEFSLSAFLLDGNSTYDAVYYEKEEASPAGNIRLGRVQIEVYDQTTAAWYTIYYWGDGAADTNASYNNGNSEPDGFPVNMSALYGTAPLNTGIAIDIDSAAIAQGGSIGDSITLIRITSLSAADCNIDSLQMLR